MSGPALPPNHGRTANTGAVGHNRSTLLFGVLLLLFVQTLTLWLECIYKVALTKLSLGNEAAALLFVFSPALIFFWPERAHRTLLWISLFLFLLARSALPFLSASSGMLIAGAGVGAFLVALCLLLSRSFSFLQGDAGLALGLAVLASMALRSWGATYDYTLDPSGAPLGWALAVLSLALLWNLTPSAHVEPPRPAVPARDLFGPVLGFFASLMIVYLVLSSPAVVEAWLGVNNPSGLILCAISWAGALLLLRSGPPLSRGVLLGWNLLFALALVGGILALRIRFPETPASPAVIVRPENPIAWVLLNLMLLLSPVVALNARAACLSLREVARARSLAAPVLLGITLLVLFTLMSIFTNTWGYVRPVSAHFRNQFHLPFLLIMLLMSGALLIPGWRFAGAPRPGLALSSLATLLAVLATAGSWHQRPKPPAVAAPNKQITVLTYNIQQGSALGGDRNWQNQLEFIRSINPDLIGLQESDTPRPSNGNISAAKFFGSKLGYHVYYGPNTVSGTYGTAILSRFPLQNPRSFFTFSNQDEVGTAVTEIQVAGRTMAFFNSHPSGSVPGKCHALELLNQAAPYEYVIAVGDYNARPNEEPFHILTGRLKDSWTERPPDQGSVSERIDHVFVSSPFKVLETFCLPSPASQTDHPAYWAVLAWD